MTPDEEKKWKKMDQDYHQDPGIIQTYDERISKKFRLEYQYFTLYRWINELKTRSSKLVLDFGCGTGMATRALKDAGIAAVSIDASMGMLQRVRQKMQEKLSPVQCVNGDVEKLPFKTASFDGLICNGVLHHVPNIVQAVESQAKVIKPGGMIFIGEPVEEKPWYSSAYHIIMELARWVRDQIKHPKLKTLERPLSRTDVDAVVQTLDRNGFNCQICYIVYWPILCRYLPEKIILPILLFLNHRPSRQKCGDSICIRATKTRSS